jgi:hypothetical protein
MPYFQTSPWPAFLLEERLYDLSHLDEYSFELTDSRGAQRHILVTFEDHCFTRKWESQDDRGLMFPGCSRKPGAFCTERYGHSLLIRDHIAQAALRDVWIADGEGFAVIPTVDSNGSRVLYCILFDLQRVQGVPFDLRMLVRTSYPLNQKSHFATHGNIRFRHLVSLRLEGRMPPRNRDARRKRPQIK